MKRTHINTQRWVLHYYAEIAPFFRKGQLKFKSNDKCVSLSYTQANLNGGSVVMEVSIPYNNKKQRDIARIIQDFVLSVYYEHERDGNRMKLKDIARLMGVTPSTMNQSINASLHKLKSWFIHTITHD